MSSAIYHSNAPLGEISVTDPRTVADLRKTLTPHINYSIRDANYGPMVERR